MDKKLVSVVVPAYREAANLPALSTALLDAFAPLASVYDFEFVFVDDGSPDATWPAIVALCQSDSRVRGVSLSRNFGHQAALTAGLDIARGDLIISMDADMQDPPAVAVEMIRKWEEGYEIVYARRRNRQDPFLKKYLALAYYWLLSRISDTDIPRNVGDFRLIDRRVLAVFRRLKEKDRYIRGMFSWLGFRTAFVDFDRPERTKGTTGYTWSKMWKLASDGVMNFSVFPLKLSAFIGVFMILLSALFFVYMVGDTIANDVYYPLYKWLSVFGFAGMGWLFIITWILGEYVGRIYNEVRERPLYIVRDSENVE